MKTSFYVPLPCRLILNLLRPLVPYLLTYLRLRNRLPLLRVKENWPNLLLRDLENRLSVAILLAIELLI